MSASGHLYQRADLHAYSDANHKAREARHAFILVAIRKDELDRQAVAERFQVSLKRATWLIAEARR